MRYFNLYCTCTYTVYLLLHRPPLFYSFLLPTYLFSSFFTWTFLFRRCFDSWSSSVFLFLFFLPLFVFFHNFLSFSSSLSSLFSYSSSSSSSFFSLSLPHPSFFPLHPPPPLFCLFLSSPSSPPLLFFKGALHDPTWSNLLANDVGPTRYMIGTYTYTYLRGRTFSQDRADPPLVILFCFLAFPFFLLPILHFLPIFFLFLLFFLILAGLSLLSVHQGPRPTAPNPGSVARHGSISSPAFGPAPASLISPAQQAARKAPAGDDVKERSEMLRSKVQDGASVLRDWREALSTSDRVSGVWGGRRRSSRPGGGCVRSGPQSVGPVMRWRTPSAKSRCFSLHLIPFLSPSLFPPSLSPFSLLLSRSFSPPFLCSSPFPSSLLLLHFPPLPLSSLPLRAAQFKAFRFVRWSRGRQFRALIVLDRMSSEAEPGADDPRS